MKKLNVAKKDACMACKACEIACSEAFYKKFDEDLSCIKISVQKDGVSPKPVVCVQCGKCAKVCQMEVNPVEDANSIECIRCGRCRQACPVQAISCGLRKQ